MDATQKFHNWGFEIYCLIGDGASSNLTMFKTLTGYTGHYGVNKKLSDRHYIKPYFTSPFTGEKLFIMICPFHMVSYYYLLHVLLQKYIILLVEECDIHSTAFTDKWYEEFKNRRN